MAKLPYNPSTDPGRCYRAGTVTLVILASRLGHIYDCLLKSAVLVVWFVSGAHGRSTSGETFM